MRGKNMKKRVYILIIVLVILVLLIPIPFHKSGSDTLELKSLIYSITKYHEEVTLGENDETSYINGWVIKILGNEIYNNLEYSKENQNSNNINDNDSTRNNNINVT